MVVVVFVVVVVPVDTSVEVVTVCVEEVTGFVVVVPAVPGVVPRQHSYFGHSPSLTGHLFG